MMATTHGLMSLALAALVAPSVSGYVAPPTLLIAAFVGGVAPDLDLLVRHRRTLHYPFLFGVAAVVGGFLLHLVPSPALLLGVTVVAAAWLHAATDVLGGSVEREPWNPTTERGVYNHVLDRWHRPRRVVPYSGAPADLLFALPWAVAAMASPVTSSGADRWIVVGVGLSGGYVLLRKRLGAIERALRAAVPS